jgi:hypothetical protein
VEKVKTEITQGPKSKPEKIMLKGLLGADSIFWIDFKAPSGQVKENSENIK